MKLWIRVIGGLVLLVVALLVATVLLLPTLLASETAAEQIRAAAGEATGSELAWEELEVALFPPALALRDVRAHSAALGDAPWFSAQRVELRLAWMPLLIRTVLIDSLAIEGLELVLRRDAEGWVLPVRGAAGDETASPASSPTSNHASATDAGFSLALRKFSVRDGVLRLDDRSGVVPHQIELTEMRADIVASSPSAPVDLSISGSLGAGGSVELEGDVSPDRDLALELHFSDVPMEIVQPYLEDELVLAGKASGVATLRGASARLERIELVLASDDAAITSEDLSASGPLELEVSLDDFERRSGVFSFDATRAVLVYKVLFQKPAGVEAEAGGSFRTRRDGSLDIDFDRVRIKDVDARGELRGGARPTLALIADPFELEGWGAMVPVLEGMRGRAAIPALEVTLPTAAAPIRATGHAVLEGVRVALPDTQVLTLNGALHAAGDVLTSNALVAEYSGHTFPLDLRVTELFGEPRWSIQSALEGLDANEFAKAFAGTPDTLFGTLSLDADLAAPAGGAVSLLQALGGKIAVNISPGRLRGVSLLRSAVDSMGPLAEAALLAGQLRGGRTVQRFFDDEFTTLSGSFALRDGSARTEDLRLVYRDYQIDLRGSVGLEDGALDLDGTLTLFDELEDKAPNGTGLESGVATERSVRRVLPLAKVRGKVDAPRVAIAPDVALAWASGFGSKKGHGEERTETPDKTRLEEKIDKRLGEGSGREIFDALEGLLQFGVGENGRK